MDIEKFVLDTETKDFLAKLAQAQAQASNVLEDFMSAEQAHFEKAHSKMKKNLADAEMSIQQESEKLSDDRLQLNETLKEIEEKKAALEDVDRAMDQLHKYNLKLIDEAYEKEKAAEKRESELTKKVKDLDEHALNVRTRLSQMSKWIIDSDLFSTVQWKASSEYDGHTIVDIHVKVGDIIKKDTPLYSVEKGFFSRKRTLSYVGSEEQLVVAICIAVGSKLKQNELILASIKSD